MKSLNFFECIGKDAEICFEYILCNIVDMNCTDLMADEEIICDEMAQCYGKATKGADCMAQAMLVETCADTAHTDLHCPDLCGGTPPVAIA